MADSIARSERVPLEQLIAFNDEIASLIRSGVPLELGLRQVGQSASGRLALLSQRLAERMETGISLQQALDDEGDRLPGVYRAVIEAGLRAGRLPQALEEMSGLARSLLALHRRIAIALLYPAIVFVLAWGLLAGAVPALIPQYLTVRERLGIGENRLTRALELLHEYQTLWSLGIPLGVLIVGLCLARRAAAEHNTSAGRLLAGRLHRFAWFPWVIENFDRATFLRTLKLLVQNRLPLHEALLLAGWATGSRSLIRDATAVAQRLQSGQTLQESLKSARQLPAFLRWMLVSGEKNGNLTAVLEATGEVYLSRATQQAELLKSVLPALLTIGIGGTATLLYCVLLYAPVIDLFRGFAEPVM